MEAGFDTSSESTAVGIQQSVESASYHVQLSNHERVYFFRSYLFIGGGDTHVGVTRQLLDPGVSRLNGKHLFLPSPLAAQRSDLISFLFVVLCIGNRASCPYLFLCYYYEYCLR